MLCRRPNSVTTAICSQETRGRSICKCLSFAVLTCGNIYESVCSFSRKAFGWKQEEFYTRQEVLLLWLALLQQVVPQDEILSTEEFLDAEVGPFTCLTSWT